MVTFYKKFIRSIKNGAIGVIPTDTLYGIVGDAFNASVVEKIYTIRRRDGDKPFIILIHSVKDLKSFGIKLDRGTTSILKKLWPGRISVILPCVSDSLSYLHRGKNTLAFRLPNDPDLLSFLKKTGPLVAPSANPEGQVPAKNVNEAKKYFGNNIDFYIDGGARESEPSTIVEIIGTSCRVIRRGTDFKKIPQTV